VIVARPTAAVPLGRLSAVVFMAGVGSLATEIAASRLLAPYFGNSTIVWANVIGLVLASLSLGYWLGGRLADRRPDPRFLGAVVAAAAVLVAATPFLARPFLDLTVEGLDEVSTGAAIGSFFGVLILFAPPVVLLGMVAPFAIRLALETVESAGAVAGRLYAVSTIGSLLGTFLSALVAIPLIGTQRTLLLSAALLAVAGATLLGVRWLALGVGLAALLAVPPGAVKSTGGVIHEDESLYQFVQVTERNGARRLYLDEGVAVHSVWRPKDVLTGGVWDTFLALPPLLGRPLERVAILGNAGGTTARAMGVYYPRADIDGVELDPAVTDAGRRYLGLDDNPRLHVHTADARPFLRHSDGGYDLIVVDAYRPPYVPFYLATREFFELVRDRLAPGGMVALNVASVPGDTRLARGIATTVAAEFPAVWTWQALRFNQIVVGLTRDLPHSEIEQRLNAVQGDLAPLTDLAARDLRPARTSGEPWTDDRAPVEWITDRMIVEYAAEGGRLDETPLPTAP
jgi:spermidine synthase